MGRGGEDVYGLAIIVLAISLGSCFACDVKGQDHVPARLAAGNRTEPVEVTIARFLCGESDARKVSAGGLLWTMKRRAFRFRVRFVTMLNSYSAPLHGNGEARGRWVRALPGILPTRHYRMNWRDGIDAARSFIAGTLRDPCKRPTFHFGSVADMRLRFPNAVPVDCGDVNGGNIYISEDGT